MLSNTFSTTIARITPAISVPLIFAPLLLLDIHTRVAGDVLRFTRSLPQKPMQLRDSRVAQLFEPSFHSVALVGEVDDFALAVGRYERDVGEVPSSRSDVL